MQVLLGRRRRHGLLGGRGRPPAGAVVGRAPQGSPGPGRGQGIGDQPGRGLERFHRAERPFPAAGDQAGARQRPPVAAGRGRGGGSRYGYDARRPDRGAGGDRRLRSGPAGGPAALAGFDQVEHGSHAGGGGCGRCDQDGAGDAARPAAEDAARGRAVAERGLVGGPGGAADRGAGVEAERSSAPGGCVVVRAERHERPCDHRGALRGRGASFGRGVFSGRSGVLSRCGGAGVRARPASGGAAGGVR
ncbi:hypothetical protein PS9374_07090 [Planomonospora sphaerica]|uniref:Uncharacterized protein n=1 Tax=Planomonospora sphaerica TaxID=161355 RepID=A0A161LZB1_9ACTN|nr:hypothetical protein PS9374_07090 [Planomonospora sphaerica]